MLMTLVSEWELCHESQASCDCLDECQFSGAPKVPWSPSFGAQPRSYGWSAARSCRRRRDSSRSVKASCAMGDAQVDGQAAASGGLSLTFFMRWTTAPVGCDCRSISRQWSTICGWSDTRYSPTDLWTQSPAVELLAKSTTFSGLCSSCRSESTCRDSV